MSRDHGTREASTYRSLVAVLLAAAMVTVTFGAWAQSPGSWTQEAELTPSDGEQADLFGNAVSLDADTALVGARWHDAQGDNAGAAYVYLRAGNAWTEQAKLTPADGQAGDHFGKDVSLDGDTAIVGAPRHGSGAAYVFTRNAATWSQQAKLTVSGIGDDAFFGRSVAVDGDTVIVGAPEVLTSVTGRSGAAYVFTRTSGSWSQTATLLPSDGETGDDFGKNVDLRGDVALIGAPREDNGNGARAGSAYVFEENGGSWSQQAKLVASTGQSDDRMGEAVALSSDTAILGAKNADNVDGVNTGVAYVFEQDGGTWSQQAELAPRDGEANDRFGEGVGVDGGTVLIGSKHDTNTNGDTAGAAYVYTRTQAGWDQTAKLTRENGDPFDVFGFSAALDGNRTLIGATGANDAGAAYVFQNTTAEDPVEDGNDETQNDGGTGGDASDDPDDPTPLPGGTVIHINGTLVAGSDETDAYGTTISEDTTRSMRFNFTAPAGMGLSVTLLDPDGNVADSDQAPPQGGQAIVKAPTESDGFLQAGTWATVLEIGTANTPSAPTTVRFAPSTSPSTLTTDATVQDPGLERANAQISGDGTVPEVVPDRFTVVDYRDERRCDPKC